MIESRAVCGGGGYTPSVRPIVPGWNAGRSFGNTDEPVRMLPASPRGRATRREALFACAKRLGAMRLIDHSSAVPIVLVSAAKVHPLALRVVREGSKVCRIEAALGRSHLRESSISALCAAHSR